VLDSSNRPHIAYIDWQNEGLRYAFWNGSEWGVETIQLPAGKQASDWVSLAVDSSGNPHISFFESWEDELWYAYKDGSSWQTEFVAHVYQAWVGYSSIALDSSDLPQIAYTGSEGLSLVRWDGSNWQAEVVDSAAADSVVSLSLDSWDTPHIPTMLEVWSTLAGMGRVGNLRQLTLMVGGLLLH